MKWRYLILVVCRFFGRRWCASCLKLLPSPEYTHQHEDGLFYHLDCWYEKFCEVDA